MVKIKRSKTLVKYAYLYHGFAGITNLDETNNTNEKFAIAYNKYEFPDRFGKNKYKYNKFGIIEHPFGANSDIQREIDVYLDEVKDYGNTESINMHRLNVDVFEASNVFGGSFPNGLPGSYRGLPEVKGHNLGTKEKPIIGTAYIYEWGTSSTLRNVGGKIGLYSSSGHRPTANGGAHQKDFFQTYHYNDSKITPDIGSGWHVGHCFHPRLRPDIDGKHFFSACIGDAFPLGGIRLVRRQKDIRISSLWDGSGSTRFVDILNDHATKAGFNSGDNQTGSVIGDLAVVGEGFDKRYFAIYTSIYGNASYDPSVRAGNLDVGIVILDHNFKFFKIMNITQAKGHWKTDKPFALHSLIAPYGKEKVLIAFEIVTPGQPFNKQGDTYFAIMDLNGNMVKGPDKAPDDVILPHGGEFTVDKKTNDVLWALGQGTKIKVFRFPYKE